MNELEDDPRTVTDGHLVRDRREALRVFFARPSPRIIATTAATAWGLRALAGPPGPRDLVAASFAVALWPFQEWFAHRHLLHLRPTTIAGVPFDPMFARKHREHHANPRDIDDTLLPTSVLAAAVPGASLVWRVVFGRRRAALTAMATYSTMALFYEWTHFIVHTSVKPKTAYGERVRRNHRLHHYKHEDHWYGFTMPWIDTLLGTDPDPADVARSPTAMNLAARDRPGAATARA